MKKFENLPLPLLLIMAAAGIAILFFAPEILERLLVPLEENAPWFFVMAAMLIAAFLMAWEQFIPWKWMPAIVLVIAGVTVAGLHLVPEEIVRNVQDDIMLPIILVVGLFLMFVGSRYQKRRNKAKAYRWQIYAIEESGKEVADEIARYNALSYVFEGFMDVTKLTDGELRLTCTRRHHVDFYGVQVPMYEFDIYWNSERVGNIRLRIGYSEGMYYSGQVGFAISEVHRGKGHALKACRLLAPVAKHHKMTKLLMTNTDGNIASYRVCEKLGAKFVRKAELPDWHDMHDEGHRYMNIFEWDLLDT
ncbi:MAG: GNAT family N-acetyltransferase [Defluviitaleaceae bacterium]|nr:GNAT family N-acetyltransferase [Defluviitaleaceae bacterium]